MDFEGKLTVSEALRLSRLRDMLVSGEAMRIRTRARVSRQEAADVCGVDAATVARWECGERRCTTRRALCYLELLDKLAVTSGPGWPD